MKKITGKVWLVLGMIAAILLNGCSQTKSDQSSKEAITESAYLAETTRNNTAGIVANAIPLYYTDAAATSLYEVEKNYDFGGMNIKAAAEQILTDLQSAENAAEETQKLALQPIIPDGTLDSFQIRSEEGSGVGEERDQQWDIMEVHLTQLYYDMSPNSKVVMRAGLSRTLFASGLVDKIEFWVPDMSIPGTEVKVLTSSSEDKLIINQYSSDFYTDEVTVNLYFGNSDGTALRAETRTLTLGMTDPLPTAIMKALIAGPEEEGLQSVIPPGTLVEDVFIKDGVCYVDLNAEFQKNHLGGATEEALTIYSIVNSLQNVSGIRYVQLLIEGKRLEYYKSYVKIDTFLTGNTDIVE